MFILKNVTLIATIAFSTLIVGSVTMDSMHANGQPLPQGKQPKTTSVKEDPKPDEENRNDPPGMFPLSSTRSIANRSMPKEGDDELTKLKKERIAVLTRELELLFQQVYIGKAPLLNHIDACKNLCYAGLDLHRGTELEVKCYELWVAMTDEMNRVTKREVEVGVRSEQDGKQVLAAHLEAKIELLAFKQKSAKQEGHKK